MLKISELTTDKAADVLCELVPFVGAIIADEELIGEVKRKISAPEGASRAAIIALGLGKITVLVPMILKRRRGDIYGILAVLGERTVEDVAQQSFLTTLAQVRTVAKDKALIDFFKSWGDGEQGA